MSTPTKTEDWTRRLSSWPSLVRSDSKPNLHTQAYGEPANAVTLTLHMLEMVTAQDQWLKKDDLASRAFGQLTKRSVQAKQESTQV
jgi:hypothetical protein